MTTIDEDETLADWSEDLIPAERAQTLDGLFHQRVARSPDRIAYRWYARATNSWQAMTWRETAAQVARWRSALDAEGLVAGDRVAILLRNCPEWIVIDQATLSLGLVTVPLYTDDRADNAAYILNDAEVKLLVIQDARRFQRLAQALDNQPWPLRAVLMEQTDTAMRARAADPRLVAAVDWLPASGSEWDQHQADPHALATIVYTSGTTGRPKGVMLSHRNILSNVDGALKIFKVFAQDEFLSFLPLSHMLERTGSYYLPMMAGASVAYARSVTQLGEDLQHIRPTLMIAVPRVFERVHARIRTQLSTRPALLRRLFALATEVGWMRFEHRQGRRDWHPLLLLWPLLRRLFARPVLSKLGGRLRAAVSGGAPLPFGVARVFIGLDVPILQGYGLTETSPVISVNPIQDNRPRSVGVLLPGIQARIGEEDELQVKGPGNMLGYWKNPAATADILDADGWLRTGDQARIDGRHLHIIGRIKDVLVLSNGEKVPPTDMELALGLDPLFEQVLIIGEGHSYLTALLVLNSDLWLEVAREHGLDPAQPASLQDASLIKYVQQRIRQVLVDFPGYAKIRRVTITLEPWSVENGLMTPTMKIKRSQVINRYQSEILEMYELDS